MFLGERPRTTIAEFTQAVRHFFHVRVHTPRHSPAYRVSEADLWYVTSIALATAAVMGLTGRYSVAHYLWAMGVGTVTGVLTRRALVIYDAELRADPRRPDGRSNSSD